MSFWEHFCFCPQKGWSGWGNHLSAACCAIPVTPQIGIKITAEGKKGRRNGAASVELCSGRATPRLSRGLCFPTAHPSLPGYRTCYAGAACGWKKGQLLAQEHQGLLKEAAEPCQEKCLGVENQRRGVTPRASVRAVLWRRWSSTSSPSAECLRGAAEGNPWQEPHFRSSIAKSSLQSY